MTLWWFGDLPDNVFYYVLLVFSIAACIYALCTENSARYKNLPPGPRGFPYVGYYPFLYRKPLETLERLKRVYGGIFSFYLGRTYCVVLSDAEAMKEAYAKEEFYARPQTTSFSLQAAKSIVELDGNNWTEIRKFSVLSLRNFGYGKTQMELEIQEEVDYLLDRLAEPARQHDDIEMAFKLSILNLQNKFLYGFRFTSTDDPTFVYLQEYIDFFPPIGDQLAVHAFFPWVKNFLALFPWTRFAKLRTYNTFLETFNNDHIQNHKGVFSPEDAKDYLNFYFAEIGNRNRGKPFDDGMLKATLLTFLRAGTGTTIAWLQWVLLATAVHSKVQSRVQKELEEVLGPEGRAPAWNDRTKLPYTQAVLNEALRWRTNVPINILRRATRDTTIRGLDVPSGTVVITNLWAIHNDPDRWKDPLIFDPERWLSHDGKDFVKHDNFLPFSFGRRDCPGKLMGSVSVFLYYTNLMRRFSVSLPEGEHNDMDSRPGVVLAPKIFRLNFHALQH